MTERSKIHARVPEDIDNRLAAMAKSMELTKSRVIENVMIDFFHPGKRDGRLRRNLKDARDASNGKQAGKASKEQ